MSRRSTVNNKEDQGILAEPVTGPAIEPATMIGPIARRGIITTADFAQAMSALMSDLASGAIPPSVGNSICLAGRNLLDAAKLQAKYGRVSGNAGEKRLQLVPPPMSEAS